MTQIMKLDHLLDLADILGRMKTLLRYEGQVFWRDYGDVPRWESVADHSYRMALLALPFAEERRLDVGKVMKMALIHDLPEVIAGDASPLGSDGTGRDSHLHNADVAATRHESELAAAREIFPKFGEELGAELFTLWEEYEEKATPEAKLLKALDTLEGEIQVWEWRRGRPMRMPHVEFNRGYWTKKTAHDPEISELARELRERLESEATIVD